MASPDPVPQNREFRNPSPEEPAEHRVGPRPTTGGRASHPSPHLPDDGGHAAEGGATTRAAPVGREESMLGVAVRWLLVCLLSWIAGAAAFDAFMGGDRSGQSLTEFICVGFFYGLALALLGLGGLLWRKYQLRRVCADLNGQELGRFLAERAHVGGPILALLRKLHAQFERNPASVDAATLIKLAHRRLSRTAMRVRRVGHLLVALGLVGTCTGLIGMLMGLTERVVASSEDGGPELMVALLSPGGPLSGLSGAYSSTLVGIVCGAIVLRFLAYVVQDGVDALTDNLEEFISVYVRPAFPTP